MLLNSFQITHILPCLADPEKIRAIAQLSDDIREVLPYLNATLKGTVYNHRAGILTFKKDGVMINLYPTTVTLAKVDDEVRTRHLMEWLKELINDTYENRKNIQPNYERGTTLRALDILKLIPGTNCTRCGEPSCLPSPSNWWAKRGKWLNAFPSSQRNMRISAKYCSNSFMLQDIVSQASFSVPKRVRQEYEGNGKIFGHTWTSFDL